MTTSTTPPIKITLTHWANHCKEYVARIDGLHEKFGLARTFQPAAERRWSRSGKNGVTDFVISAPGFYEIQEPETGGYGGKDCRRWFQLTEAGEVIDCSEKEIYAAFNKQILEPRAVQV